MGQFRPLLIAIGVLLAVSAGVLYWAPRWTPSRWSYPVQGIDVSAHQRRIDWVRLSRQGVDFSYIKATEGCYFRDKRFIENWNGAARAGIRRGACHFFTLCKPGAEQA